MRAIAPLFCAWQEQLLNLGDEDISQQHNYPNPPVMAVLLYPLARLPALASALGSVYLKVALTMLALVWIFQDSSRRQTANTRRERGLTILLQFATNHWRPATRQREPVHPFSSSPF